MIETHLASYTAEEKRLIAKDFAVVESVCFGDKKNPQGIQKEKIYLATAGGPGARKSTILERFMQTYYQPHDFVYLDPDMRALRFMAHTYHALSFARLVTNREKDFTIIAREAYEKWRGASNYITLSLFEKAITMNRSIAHGTTSTGGHLPTFCPSIKKKGYKIVLLLCLCEDELRSKAVEYRNTEQKFYQSTPEDAVSKGLAFIQRMPVYFEQADELHLFWSNDLETPEIECAIFKTHKLQTLDEKSYLKFVSQFEKMRKILASQGTEVPAWETITEEGGGK